MLRTLAMLACGLCSTTAIAADIDAYHVPTDGRPAEIAIIGEIRYGDERKFASVASRFRRAIVGLASPGGNVWAAVHIGDIIRRKRFTTAVAPKMTCASSCALIWLAGTHRYVWENAKIGFHGVFNGQTLQTSGPGNGMFGAYLNKLGLSYEAIAYLTAASPTDMTWLHGADAKRVGIAATAISESDNDTLMVADAPVPRSLRDQAIEFVGQWFNAWNTLSDNEIMPWLATRYADTIVFNGAAVPVAKVFETKQNIVNDWPLHRYDVGKDMIVNCIERLLECEATGTATLIVAKAPTDTGKYATTRWSFYLGKVSPTKFVIMRESWVSLTKSGG